METALLQTLHVPSLDQVLISVIPTITFLEDYGLLYAKREFQPQKPVGGLDSRSFGEGSDWTQSRYH